MHPKKPISRSDPGDALSHATPVTDLIIWQIFSITNILSLLWHFFLLELEKKEQETHNYIAVPTVENSLKIFKILMCI